tara:strand:- start:482 stop:775 length:294 start_codon:yes stop_codon:yes gene_type:complete
MVDGARPATCLNSPESLINAGPPRDPTTEGDASHCFESKGNPLIQAPKNDPVDLPNTTFVMHAKTINLTKHYFFNPEITKQSIRPRLTSFVVSPQLA